MKRFNLKKIALFSICALIFLLLKIPSWFEPWWYGDESFYMAIAQGMAKDSQLLYTQTWDNKPPLIYLIYAASYGLFGNSLLPLRVLNTALGGITIILTTLIAKDIFVVKKMYSLLTITGISTIIWGLYLESQIFNAENIFVPLVLGGVWIVGTHLTKLRSSQVPLGISGALFSLAILTKIPALVEIGIVLGAFAIVWLVTEIIPSIQNSTKLISLEQSIDILKSWGPVIVGLCIPIATALVYFMVQGTLQDVWFAVFEYNQTYYITPTENVVIFGANVALSGMQLRVIISGALGALLLYLYTQKAIPKHVFLILCWIIAVIFSVFLSERPFGHYLLQAVPAVVIGFGMWLEYITTKMREDILLKSLVTALALISLHTTLTYFTEGKHPLQYVNTRQYAYEFYNTVGTGNSIQEWQKTFDRNVVTRQEILVPQIQKYSAENDSIFILGNAPDLYFLSERVNATPYMVDYHPLVLTESDTIEELLQDVAQNNTKLLVQLDGSPWKQSKNSLEKLGYTEVFTSSFGEIYQRR